MTSLTASLKLSGEGASSPVRIFASSSPSLLAAAKRKCPEPQAGSQIFKERRAVSFSSLVLRFFSLSSITGCRQGVLRLKGEKIFGHGGFEIRCEVLGKGHHSVRRHL